MAKPNSHRGNSDAERLSSTITEKLCILNMNTQIPIRTLMLKAIKSYNNQYHNTIKTTTNNVEEGKIPAEKIYNRLIESQSRRLKKHNRNREDYEETRDEGYIKYYKSVRHKDQPKFRKYKLSNVHPINIKRPLKFAGKTTSNTANDAIPPDDNGAITDWKNWD